MIRELEERERFLVRLPIQFFFRKPLKQGPGGFHLTLKFVQKAFLQPWAPGVLYDGGDCACTIEKIGGSLESLECHHVQSFDSPSLRLRPGLSTRPAAEHRLPHLGIVPGHSIELQTPSGNQCLCPVASRVFVRRGFEIPKQLHSIAPLA